MRFPLSPCRPAGTWYDQLASKFVGGNPRYENPAIVTSTDSRVGHNVISEGTIQIKVEVLMRGFGTDVHFANKSFWSILLVFLRKDVNEQTLTASDAWEMFFSLEFLSEFFFENLHTKSDSISTAFWSHIPHHPIHNVFIDKWWTELSGSSLSPRVWYVEITCFSLHLLRRSILHVYDGCCLILTSQHILIV